jgi:hypothetical protein
LKFNSLGVPRKGSGFLPAGRQVHYNNFTFWFPLRWWLSEVETQSKFLPTGRQGFPFQSLTQTELKLTFLFNDAFASSEGIIIKASLFIKL